MSRQEFVYNTKNHLNSYIKLAEQKASILLTAQLAFLGLFANALRALSISGSIWFQVFAVLSGVAGLIGVFLAGWTVYPRTPKQKEKSHIFWENIREHGSESNFRASIHELDEDEIVNEVIDENYQLAKVAQEKYRYLRWSLRTTAVMVGFAVLAGIVYLLSM